MPIRERLSAKEIHRDWRRLRSISGVAGGAVAPHTLLGIVHSDTAVNAPVQGALIVANDTPEWTALMHPLASGYAIVTTDTDTEFDIDPIWEGRHSWDDGGGVTAYIDEDGSADFDGYVAIGPNATVQTNAILYVRNTATDSAETNFGTYLDIVKTAGATDTSDLLTGTYSRTYLNQAGGTIGTLRGIQSIARVDAGSVGSGGVPLPLWGVDSTVDLNAGTVFDDAIGIRSNVDQEAGSTVGGDIIGVYSRVDADGTVTGAVYGVQVVAQSNVDWAYYCANDVSSALRGALTVGATNIPAAQLDVDQSAAAGAIPVLMLDQGDASEQHIVVSMDGADQDFPAILQLDVTGDPTLWWDESESRLIWDEHLGLSAGNLYFASTYGIDHADDAAGDYLVLQGGLYVPGALPGGFTGFANPTASVGLVAVNGVATTAMRSDAAPPLDQGIAPTWTSAHIHAANVTLDDGAGNSPLMRFVGGTNDDLAFIYLVDDAVTGNSDLAIALVADDADAQLLIRNASLATVAYIDATGDADFADVTIDEYLIHDGDADTYLRFQDDNITLHVGAVDLLDLVEGATDYVLFGAQADLNGNDLIIDTDGDTYLHEIADDQAGLVVAGNLRYTFTASQLILADAGGTDRVWIRTHGDVGATAADVLCRDGGGFAAQDDVNLFIDSDNDSTTAAMVVWKDAETTAAATELFRIQESAEVDVNSTNNTDMTIGITINQDATDDEILCFKSSDVSHPMTSLAEADSYGTFDKDTGSSGGLRIRGFREDTSGASPYRGLSLVGLLSEAADTGKTTADRGVISINAAVSDGGTSITSVGADGNLVTIENNGTTRFIFDAEGSGHADVEWTTFDEHDDLALLDSLESSFGQFAKEHRAELEALRIAAFDDRDDHAMVNFTRLSMLLVGALRQVGTRLDRLDRALIP